MVWVWRSAVHSYFGPYYFEKALKQWSSSSVIVGLLVCTWVRTQVLLMPDSRSCICRSPHVPWPPRLLKFRGVGECLVIRGTATLYFWRPSHFWLHWQLWSKSSEVEVLGPGPQPKCQNIGPVRVKLVKQIINISLHCIRPFKRTFLWNYLQSWMQNWYVTGRKIAYWDIKNFCHTCFSAV
jgi:hypothetical protein